MSKFGYIFNVWLRYHQSKSSVNWRHKKKVVEYPNYIMEYKRLAKEVLQSDWKLLNSTEWKLERKGVAEGDVIEAVYDKTFGKIFRFTGVIDCDIEKMHKLIFTDIANMPKWNSSCRKSEVVKNIGPGIDITHNMSTPRRAIATRDFVLLRYTAKISDDGKVIDTLGSEASPYSYIICSVSVDYPELPPTKDIIRGENKVVCWLIRPKLTKTPDGNIREQTLLQWTLSCDLKGLIPRHLVNTALASSILEQVKCIRKQVKNL